MAVSVRTPAEDEEAEPVERPVILVPILHRDQLDLAVSLIGALALARDADLVLLEIERPAYEDGEAVPDSDWLESYAARIEEATDDPVDVRIERRLGHNLVGVLREAVRDLDPELLLLTWRQRRSRRLLPDERMLLDVLVNLPCDTAILGGAALTEDGLPARVLVADAAPDTLAGQLAQSFAASSGAPLTVLVGSSGGPNAEEQVAAWNDAVDQADVTEIPSGTSTVDAIVEHAEALGDVLVVLPAPSNGVLHRLAIGSNAERVARRSPAPVLIVKERRGAAVSRLQHVIDALGRWLPPLSEERKVDVYREVRRASRARADFFVLVGLAAVIAAVGLLLDSVAVVIGGMLVAPLMSPVVGMGLAVVQGDARFLKLALLSTVRGAALAVLVGVVAVLTSPGQDATSEVLARGGPSLLDLIVAIAAGAAAAYALSREQLSASLPGVAIAVAIVPPLNVIGIGLGLNDLSLAGGAALLFGTNVVAIAASSGLVFLWLGFRPEPDDRGRVQVSGRGFVAFAALLVVVAAPLTWLTVETVREDRFQRTLEVGIEEAFAALPGIEADGYTLDGTDGDTLRLTVEVKALAPLELTQVLEIEDALAERLQRPVDLRLLILQATELNADTESTPVSPGSSPLP